MYDYDYDDYDYDEILWFLKSHNQDSQEPNFAEVFTNNECII